MSLISIIIPTFNSECCIRRAIDSVLNQTFRDYEIIICDDCSSDNTKGIVLEYTSASINIIWRENEKNSGPAAARNLGIRTATGEYIAFLDSDDEWLPKKLEVQVERITKMSSDYAVVYSGDNMIINENKNAPIIRIPSREYEKDSLSKLLTGKIQYSTSSLLIRRHCLLVLGGFNSEMRIHEDHELLTRLLIKYKLLVISEPLLNTHYTVSNSRRILCQLEHSLQFELANLPAIKEKLGNGQAEAFRSWLYSTVLYSAIREFHPLKSFHYLRTRINQQTPMQICEYQGIVKSILVMIFGDVLLPLWHIFKIKYTSFKRKKKE